MGVEGGGWVVTEHHVETGQSVDLQVGAARLIVQREDDACTPGMEINFFAHQPLWQVDLKFSSFLPATFYTLYHFLINAYILNNIIVTIDKKSFSYASFFPSELIFTLSRFYQGTELKTLHSYR